MGHKKAHTHIIRIRGNVVPDDFQYETSLGTFSRKEIVERYARTVQDALAGMSTAYSPFKAGELIMRAVIGLMTAEGPENSAEYIVNKLENGLSCIGYFLEEGLWVTPPESVIPELHVTGAFPRDPDELCHDYETGEQIGLAGVSHYLTVLEKCLSKTERSLCDKAALQFVKAVQLLIEQVPGRNTRQIELLLLKGLQELNLHITIAPWYKRQLAKSN
ncbi:MAG: hypothetical protein V1668_00895 [Patescibacteria group bacterium]